MTRVVAADGYAGASVARVAAVAGASRATFYEHFRSREACFEAAYRSGVEEVLARARGASEPGDPATVIASLLRQASEEPELARLLLVEAMAGPSAIRRDRERRLLAAERSLIRRGDCLLQLPPGTLHGGITAVASSAVIGGDEQQLAGLLPPLTAWVRSYARPAGAETWDEGAWRDLGRRVLGAGPGAGGEAPAGPPPRLPRGRSAAPASYSAQHRRRRILDATMEVVAAKGYAAASVGEIVARARVARGAFYSHFRCKRDAFLAAVTRSLQESVAAAAQGFFPDRVWPDRVWNGLRGLLDYLGRNPDAAHVGIVGFYAAGEPALRQSLHNRQAFTLFLADGYRQSERAEILPSLFSEAIAGAVEGLIRGRILEGAGDRVLELLPQCAYVALAPFIGSEEALELVTAKSHGRTVE